MPLNLSSGFLITANWTRLRERMRSMWLVPLRKGILGLISVMAQKTAHTNLCPCLPSVHHITLVLILCLQYVQTLYQAPGACGQNSEVLVGGQCFLYSSMFWLFRDDVNDPWQRIIYYILRCLAYPNNKPLITKETKLIINKNKTDLLYWQSSREKGGLQRSK